MSNKTGLKFASKRHEEIYDELVTVLREAGEAALAQDARSLFSFAANLELEEDALADIAENGFSLTVSGDKGSTVTKGNPACEALNRVSTSLRFYYKQFKMTPEARGKILKPSDESISDDV